MGRCWAVKELITHKMIVDGSGLLESKYGNQLLMKLTKFGSCLCL